MNPSHAIQIQTTPDYNHLSAACAAAMLDCVTTRPDAVICLATGHSPLGAYRRFVQQVQEQHIDLSQVRFVKLDEWLGPPPEDPATCEAFIRQEILTPLNIAPASYLAFDGQAADPQAECARVAAALRALTAIDLIILGVGKNGHIGLNEPAPELLFGAHVATLADSTRDHPMLRSATMTITQGLTLGVGDLLAAKKAVLLFTGSGKGAALAAFRAQTLTTRWPVTLMRLHPNLLCLADPSAT